MLLLSDLRRNELTQYILVSPYGDKDMVNIGSGNCLVPTDKVDLSARRPVGIQLVPSNVPNDPLWRAPSSRSGVVQ